MDQVPSARNIAMNRWFSGFAALAALFTLVLMIDEFRWLDVGLLVVFTLQAAFFGLMGWRELPRRRAEAEGG